MLLILEWQQSNLVSFFYIARIVAGLPTFLTGFNTYQFVAGQLAVIHHLWRRAPIGSSYATVTATNWPYMRCCCVNHVYKRHSHDSCPTSLTNTAVLLSSTVRVPMALYAANRHSAMLQLQEVVLFKISILVSRSWTPVEC